MFTLVLLALPLSAADLIYTNNVADTDSSTELARKAAYGSMKLALEGFPSSQTFAFSYDSPAPVVSMLGRFNAQVDRDTTAGGIAAGKILAPVVVWDDVGISSTNGVLIQHFYFLSGDTTTATNEFKAYLCRAPITWGSTNADFNAVISELGTNNVYTIDSKDTKQGRWTSIGKTNIAWYSYPLGIHFDPATNTGFIYLENTQAITNINPAWITISYWR